MVRVETERLVLEMPGPEHVPELVAYERRNREHLDRWGPPAPADVQGEQFWERRVAEIRRDFEAGRAVRFSVFRREAPGGRVIGGVSLTNIVLGPLRACNLGYHLDAQEQGNGLMSEAVRAVVRHAFDELKLHRVQANYVPSNERSARLLKRLGFCVEGYARDDLFVGGEWRDHVLTSVVNHELGDARELCTPR